jgi:hypothetical protein
VYQRGIKIFKESVINDLASMSDDLNRSEYWIRLKIRKDERGITVSVSNNIDILRDEMDRINYRIRKATESADFTEAYENVYDPTEGAGLGIILSILLLKNAGIDPACYQIISSKGNTSVSLLIPVELRPADTNQRDKKADNR